MAPLPPKPLDGERNLLSGERSSLVLEVVAAPSMAKGRERDCRLRIANLEQHISPSISSVCHDLSMLSAVVSLIIMLVEQERGC